MKSWIKIETSLNNDPRINRLTDELGAKGLGIYLVLRVLTDQNVKGCTMRTLYEAGSYLTSRRIVERVVFGFDLFAKVGNGIYRACPLIDPYADLHAEMSEESRADAHAGTRECDRMPDRADVPLNEREENRKENTLKESEGEASEDEKIYLANMRQEFPNVCRMKQPLTYAEFLRLMADYPRELIHSVLNDMENRPDLTRKYLSANLTCRSWINARRHREN